MIGPGFNEELKKKILEKERKAKEEKEKQKHDNRNS